MHLRQSINRMVGNEYGLAFCLSFLLLFCITYQLFISFDPTLSPDPRTYWGLAHFDFEQSVIRKYRVIIPFFAAGVNWVAVHLIRLIKHGPFNGDYTLRIIFYSVNLLCSATWCTLIYAYLRQLKRSKLASLVGMLMLVVSKYTIILTATYMVDPFYCCFIALALIGIETKNARLIFISILIGPFAKENFMFMLPVIFFFSGIPKQKIILWSLLSGLLLFVFRYTYDRLTGHPMQESLASDTEHFIYILNNSKRFLVSYWLWDVFGTVSFWWMIPFAVAWLTEGFRKHLQQEGKWYMWVWGALVLVQMLMSGDLSRMLYLFMPVYCFIIALAIDHYLNYLKGESLKRV